MPIGTEITPVPPSPDSRSPDWGTLRAYRRKIEHRRQALGAAGPEDRDLVHIGKLGRSLRQGDGLHERRLAGYRVNAGMDDRAIDRHSLACGFLDGHGDARIVQVFLAKLGRNIVGELLGCPPARRHFSDQRQKDRAAAIDADGLAEVLHLKDGNLERILRADPVVVRHEA